jgi:hypothetical protein
MRMSMSPMAPQLSKEELRKGSDKTSCTGMDTRSHLRTIWAAEILLNQ